MQGEVNARYEAIVRLPLITDSGGIVELDAVVDTGFSGWLTVTQEIIAGCGFVYSETVNYTLADGSQIEISVYSGLIDWLGQTQKVRVVSTGSTPLIGMRLLEGCRVSLDVTDGGPVTISPI